MGGERRAVLEAGRRWEGRRQAVLEAGRGWERRRRAVLEAGRHYKQERIESLKFCKRDLHPFLSFDFLPFLP